jgi:SAM-dependent methyltransferase
MTQNEQTIFRRYAHLYDRIYHWKDYTAEAAIIHALLLNAGVREGGRVVEAACGTGNYLERLNDWYDVIGFDLNPATLEVARSKLPHMDIFEADMADFDLDKPADAIVCLFSSIGYVAPGEKLRAVAKSFYRNLNPGGVALIDPWIEPSAAIHGHTIQHTYADDNLKLCRAGIHRVDERRSTLEFQWLVTTEHGVEHFVDNHTLWMTTRDEMAEVFQSAGFETTWDPNGVVPGRGALIATRC